MAVISKKYKHNDPFIDREFNSLVDQLNRHLQGKLLDIGQIPVGLNAYSIPEDVTADRALDTEYINDRDKDQGKWVWITVDLNAEAAANATAGIETRIGYKTPNLVICDPEILSGQNRRQVTCLIWVPNRYRYIAEKVVANGGLVTLVRWLEMDWRF